MVFDVARAFDVVRRRRAALEFVENGAERLAHDVGQHVEPAAMRHADDDLLEAELAAALDDLLERRDQRLAAVEAEPLGAGILDVEESCSKPSASTACRGWPSCLPGEGRLLVRSLDTLAAARTFWSGSEMCMNSMPIVEQ